MHRDDFAGFVHTGTSISDGTALRAWIDWDAALSALHDGQIPMRRGTAHPHPRRGPSRCLRYTLPGLADRNLKLLTTAIRHAAGHPLGHR